MLNKNHASLPLMRLNLDRPKNLLVAFLQQSQPNRILALDADGLVYFDRDPDSQSQIDRTNSSNWPLDTCMADLEKDLQLRDAVLPRYVELFRYGYLARHHSNHAFDVCLVHINGDRALDFFSQELKPLLQSSPNWIVLENLSKAPLLLSSLELLYQSKVGDFAIYGKPNFLTGIDLDILIADFNDINNHAATDRSRRAKSEGEKILSYNLLREIHLKESSFAQRLSQTSALALIYVTAWAIGPLAPKRREKLLRSARKRDPKIVDHRYLNKLIRNYAERLKLQKSFLDRIGNEIRATARISFSILIDLRKSDATQILLDFIGQGYAGPVQIIICTKGKPGTTLLSLTKGIQQDVIFVNSEDDHAQDNWLADAIAQSKAEYVLYAQNGYRYDNHLLNAVERHLAEYPDTSIVYTDEDEMLSDGERIHPKFKSAWNPDLFYNCNYFGNPVFIRSDLLKSLDWRACHDPRLIAYASALRLLEQAGGHTVQHLDLILATRQPNAQSERLETQRRTLLRDHLDRLGLQKVGLVEAKVNSEDSVCHLAWPCEAERAPLVSLIMPTHNQLAVTRTAINSILQRSRYQNFEILLIDNNSDDPEMLYWLKDLPLQDSRIRVLRDTRPFNFSAINNAAFCHAAGEIIGLVNNDIEVISEDWLEELVTQALRPDIGCVGAKLLYPNGEIQHAGVNIDLVGDMHHLMRMCAGTAPGYMGRLDLQQNYLAVTGACLFLKRSVFAATGGLNQIDLPIGCSDIDLCLKAQALGLRNLWTPRATLFHYESISRGLDITEAKRLRAAREHAFMMQRWDMVGQRDPYFNAAIAHSDMLCGACERDHHR